MATLNEDSHSYLLDLVGHKDADIAALERILSRKRYRRRRGTGWSVMVALAASLLLGTTLAIFANFGTSAHRPVEDAMVELDVNASSPAAAPDQNPVAREDVDPKRQVPERGVLPGGAGRAVPMDVGPAVLPGALAPSGEVGAPEITTPMR